MTGPEQRLTLAEQVVGIVRLLAQQSLIDRQGLFRPALPAQHAGQQELCFGVIRALRQVRAQGRFGRVQLLRLDLPLGGGDIRQRRTARQRQGKQHDRSLHRRPLSRRRIRASSSSGWKGLVT